jgi:hypothetical protein
MKEDEQTSAPAGENIIRFDASDRMFSDAAPEHASGNATSPPDTSDTEAGKVIMFPGPTDSQADSQCCISIYPEICASLAGSDGDPFEALSEPFRRRIKWKSSPESDSIRSCNLVVGMERPYPLEAVDSGMRFVAVDSQNYAGTATLDHASNQKLWEAQINVRPVPPQFVKAALPIWRKLNFSISLEQTKSLMQMTSIDEGTAEAVQAALFNTFNTSPYPIDMEAVVFALACFIHGDPLRKDHVLNESFDEPYGERTAYGLWDFSPEDD